MAAVPPLLHLLLAKPELLTAHLAAYGALAAEEGAACLAPWQRRWRLRLLGWIACTLALLFAGQGLLLMAFLPRPTGEGAWLLLGVPLVPSMLGAWALLAARRHGVAPSLPSLPFAALRHQLALDWIVLNASSQQAPATPAAT